MTAKAALGAAAAAQELAAATALGVAPAVAPGVAAPSPQVGEEACSPIAEVGYQQGEAAGQLLAAAEAYPQAATDEEQPLVPEQAAAAPEQAAVARRASQHLRNLV